MSEATAYGGFTHRRREETPAEAGVPGADDRDRTGDLNLGKVALYQLSHVRETAVSGVCEAA